MQPIPILVEKIEPFFRTDDDISLARGIHENPHDFRGFTDRYVPFIIVEIAGTERNENYKKTYILQLSPFHSASLCKI